MEEGIDMGKKTTTHFSQHISPRWQRVTPTLETRVRETVRLRQRARQGKSNNAIQITVVRLVYENLKIFKFSFFIILKQYGNTEKSSFFIISLFFSLSFWLWDKNGAKQISRLREECIAAIGSVCICVCRGVYVWLSYICVFAFVELNLRSYGNMSVGQATPSHHDLIRSCSNAIGDINKYVTINLPIKKYFIRNAEWYRLIMMIIAMIIANLSSYTCDKKKYFLKSMII